MTKEGSGFELPVDIDAPRTKCVFLCIPDDPNHIAAFWGHLYYLSYWFAWKKDDDHNATLAAQVWRNIWHDARACWEENPDMAGDCNFCCDEQTELLQQILDALLANGMAQQTIINNQTITNYETRETIYNTYISAPTTIHVSTPDTYYIKDSGDPWPDAADDRRAALCYAVDAYTTHIWAQAIEYIQQTTGAAALIAAGVATLFTPVAGIVTLAICGALAALAGALTQAILADEAARMEVRCCMYLSLELSSTTTHDSWLACLDSCGFTEPSNEYYLANVIKSSLSDDTNWLIFLKLLGESYDLVVSGLVEQSTSRCVCGGNSTCWDFAGGYLQGWLEAEGTEFELGLPQQETISQFDDLVGGVNDYSIGTWGSGSDFGAYVELPTETTVTHYTMHTWESGTSIGRPFWVRFFDADKNYLGQETGTHAGGQGWYTDDHSCGPYVDVKYVSVHYERAFRAALDVLILNDGSSGVRLCSGGA